MAILLFGLLFSFILLSVPVGIAIGLSSIITALFGSIMNGSYIVRTLTIAYDSFPIIAVPLFLLAGEIMSKGGISEKLFNLARLFVGRFTGGVPMAVVISCLLFGALSGAGAADTAAVGCIMIPAMVKMGYEKGFSASIVAAAGGLAIIMPPSLPLILFGVASNTSIGDLFLAGVVPAIVTTGLLMIYCYVYCKRNGFTNDVLDLSVNGKPMDVIKDSSFAILMPMIILGGIYSGYFTPTEAAGIAVFYGLVISLFVYKTIKFKDVYGIVLNAAKTIGPILIILGNATLFARILIIEQIPQQIAQFILSISDTPFVFLLIVNVLLIFVGIFMETLSSVLILTPILLPIAITMGINPIHFGIMMVVNLAIGFITPPMAVNLFIVSSIADMTVEELVKDIVKPFAVLIIALLLITYVPWFSLCLTN